MANRSLRSARLQLRQIRRSLAALERSLKTLAKTSDRTAKAARPPRRRRPLTLKRRAQLKLQGQYLGLMRHLTARQKALVRAINEKKGYPAAINRARVLVG